MNLRGFHGGREVLRHPESQQDLAPTDGRTLAGVLATDPWDAVSCWNQCQPKSRADRRIASVFATATSFFLMATA